MSSEDEDLGHKGNSVDDTLSEKNDANNFSFSPAQGTTSFDYDRQEYFLYFLYLILLGNEMTVAAFPSTMKTLGGKKGRFFKSLLLSPDLKCKC